MLWHKQALRYAELFHKFLTNLCHKYLFERKSTAHQQLCSSTCKVSGCSVCGIKTLCVIILLRLCFLMFATKNKLIPDLRSNRAEILVIPMYWNCILSLFKMNNLSCLWINNLKIGNLKVSFSGWQLLGMILSICLCRNVHMEDYTKVPKYWSSAEEVTLLNSRNTQIGSKVFGEIVSKGIIMKYVYFFSLDFIRFYPLRLFVSLVLF